jgi:DtxR family Mn-dependent transcriptional regulator
MNQLAIASVLAALILTAICAPRFGLLATWKKWKAVQARELLEDALKQLLSAEELGARSSATALVTALRISPSRAERLLREMEARGFVNRGRAKLRLTAAGKRWAMQVVRAHRLWERYLADEARMPIDLIHAEANHREHRLTTAGADDMAAALGYPVSDPHGDPIPTRRGSLLRRALTPITEWPLRRRARIVHIEDEPPAALQQIIASGLRPGMELRVLSRSTDGVILADDKHEYALTRAVAVNVQVAVPKSGRPARPAGIRLSTVTRGTPVEILRLDYAVQGFTRRRFLDLGLTPGTKIQPELENSFGDPRGYRVRGTLIALRQDQADNIWVRPVIRRPAEEGRAASAGHGDRV